MRKIRFKKRLYRPIKIVIVKNQQVFVEGFLGRVSIPGLISEDHLSYMYARELKVYSEKHNKYITMSINRQVSKYSIYVYSSNMSMIRSFLRD